jgi:hypothetical protein
MRPEPKSVSCDYPNYFSNVVTPAVEKRLPERGSIAAKIVNHTTGIGPFLDVVSKELCEDGSMSPESGKGLIKFVTRSATSIAVVGGTAALAGIGLTVGSPVAAIGAGLFGLATLPPLAERAVLGLGKFASELLAGVKRSRE